MSKSIFLSHNHADKDFVRKLARDLENHGVVCWVDEAELKIGDSLIEKIREGIDSVDYFAVVLSSNSIQSPWVKNELDVAMNHHISGKKIKVLPLKLEDCDFPGFLVGKVYADFTKKDNYIEAFKMLLATMEIVFNRNVMSARPYHHNLGTALDKAITANLPIMHKPFHRPFKYIGMAIDEVEKELGVTRNSAGNLCFDNVDAHLFLEVDGNFVSYIEVSFKKMILRNVNQIFDPEQVLGALSIGLHELEFARKRINSYTYNDHIRKLQVTVSYDYNEATLRVSFSLKYYGA